MLAQRLKTARWHLIVPSVLLAVASILLIINASCSKPHGMTAEAPVCVGGQLSIQAWLVIVGLEFGILGFFLLPKLGELLISKALTRKLTGDGLGFASLLNSQLSAPLMAQMRFGLKRVLGIRIATLVVIAIFSILYKYSFVRVERFSTINLADTQTPVLLGDNSGSYKNGMSNNLVDALSGNMAHGSSNMSFQPGSSLRAKQYTQVYGPSKPAYAPHLKTGTEFLCTPTYYSRNKIVPNEEYWSRPTITNAAYNNGVRFFDTVDGTLADVYSANGTLQILSANYGPPTTYYTSKLTATVSVCVGYASWLVNNTASPESNLRNPVDIDCYQESFELIPWTDSPGAQFTLNLLQGLNAKNINNLPQATSTMNVILASMNYSEAITILEAKLKANLLAKSVKSAMPAECLSSRNAQEPWVISGVSYNNGTGMTLLGAILQGLVLLFALLALILLFWPTPALLTEWPAQWLVLASSMNQATVQRAVRNASFGRNEVGGELWINMKNENDKRIGKKSQRNSLIFNADEIVTKRYSYRRKTEDGLKRYTHHGNGVSDDNGVADDIS
jgi:hypothetical protein